MRRILFFAVLGQLLLVRVVSGQAIYGAPSPSPPDYQPMYQPPPGPVIGPPNGPGAVPPAGPYLPPTNGTMPSGPGDYVGLLGPAAIAAPVTPLPPPKIAAPPKLWEGNFELGLDGNEGNSPNFNLHLGGKLKRKTEQDTLSAEMNYRQNTSSHAQTANRGLLEDRYEHMFADTPWTAYIHNEEDYDEFKAYHLRASIDAGIGFHMIKNDMASLIARCGGGGTGEFESSDLSNKYISEIVWGLDGELKLSKAQKVSAAVEYRPNVSDFGDYRINAKAAWEIQLSEENHLSLKFSVLDRYDAIVTGSIKPNDLDYATTLLWNF